MKMRLKYFDIYPFLETVISSFLDLTKEKGSEPSECPEKEQNTFECPTIATSLPMTSSSSSSSSDGCSQRKEFLKHFYNQISCGKVIIGAGAGTGPLFPLSSTSSPSPSPLSLLYLFLSFFSHIFLILFIKYRH